jgi:hypothetical protein
VRRISHVIRTRRIRTTCHPARRGLRAPSARPPLRVRAMKTRILKRSCVSRTSRRCHAGTRRRAMPTPRC